MTSCKRTQAARSHTVSCLVARARPAVAKRTATGGASRKGSETTQTRDATRHDACQKTRSLISLITGYAPAGDYEAPNGGRGALSEGYQVAMETFRISVRGVCRVEVNLYVKRSKKIELTINKEIFFRTRTGDMLVL